MSRLLYTNKGFELLEPYEGKLSRTVLRGESSRKGADLLDIDQYLNEAHSLGLISVRAHFNVMTWSDNPEELKQIKSMRRGIITNRNKFVLGPSGSGKSFFMNHLVRQYWEQGTHIVLVDTGNSYQGYAR